MIDAHYFLAAYPLSPDLSYSQSLELAKIVLGESDDIGPVHALISLLLVRQSQSLPTSRFWGALQLFAKELTPETLQEFLEEFRAGHFHAGQARAARALRQVEDWRDCALAAEMLLTEDVADVLSAAHKAIAFFLDAPAESPEAKSRYQSLVAQGARIIANRKPGKLPSRSAHFAGANFPALAPASTGPAPAVAPPVQKKVDEIAVWSRQELFELIAKNDGLGDEVASDTRSKFLTRMSHQSGLKKLVQIPGGDPSAALAPLREAFPHFSAVIDFIEDSLFLAACGEEGSPAVIPPVLLRGDPGLGKTYFGQEIARVLGISFIERDLSITSEAFVLSGLDPSWRGSKPGVVGSSLVSGDTANPLILLNEVDKANRGGERNAAIQALYSLLEPTSARAFQDEYIQLSMDTSRINWILTANDGHIPSPILSRVEVFDVPSPTHAQSRQIAKSVWASITAKSMPRGHGFAPSLSDDVLDVISSVPPRLMRKALVSAAGACAHRGAKVLLPDDVRRSLKRGVPKTSLGFLG